MEWHKMYYNGLETNIECTKDGKVRRIKVDWSKRKNVKIGEVNWLEAKPNNKYHFYIGILVKGLKTNPISIHQLIYATFNPKYQFNLVESTHKTKYKIDHIDGDIKNNNINNLQLIDHSLDVISGKIIKKRNNLPIGVFKTSHKSKDKIYTYYRAVMFLTKISKPMHLGNFKTPEEASEAYQKKLNEIKQLQYENLSSY